ncbi:MAG: hypothetical protein JNK89_02905, partial [Saprospiraceae bacterium]|nr:hypothetical protein [Saprospiraceae bacterium]
LAGGDVVLTIAIDPFNVNQLLCSTAPLVSAKARVFRVNAANGLAVEMTGLPDRLCMDIAYVPDGNFKNRAYAVFSGFNTGHVWRTTDGGVSWVNIDNGLPDVPTNSVFVDPMWPQHVYVGNDLGVWLSRNGGDSWELFSGGAPQALLVHHLSATPDRKLRVATHGLGVWQTPLEEVVGTQAPEAAVRLQLRPNPATDQAVVDFTIVQPGVLRLRVFDLQGREVLRAPNRQFPAGSHSWPVDCGSWPACRYGILLENAAGRKVAAAVLVKR